MPSTPMLHTERTDLRTHTASFTRAHIDAILLDHVERLANVDPSAGHVVERTVNLYPDETTGAYVAAVRVVEDLTKLPTAA